MEPYELYDIYSWPAGIAFWPVFRRPGRQRRSRLAFDSFVKALEYGARVETRYRRMFMKAQISSCLATFAGLVVLIVLMMFALWVLLGSVAIGGSYDLYP